MLSYAGPRTTRRKRSRHAILSFILSGYIVAAPMLLFFGGALLFHVGESVVVIMLLSLPLAFISSFVFAIRAICGRDDPQLSNCAFAVWCLTALAAVGLLLYAFRDVLS
jgi:hypothetical protein